MLISFGSLIWLGVASEAVVTEPKGDPLYAREKLSQAVYELAKGPGDVRSRLFAAYLVFHPVQPRDLPEELRADYEWIVTMPTRYPKRFEREGAINHTLSRMQNRTWVKVAQRIVYLSDRLRAILGG